MASDLVLPFLPSNMEVPPDMANAQVEGDLYDICERIREIDPDLRIAPLPEDDNYRFCITEQTPTGTRMVTKVQELDARILEHVRRMRAIPLHKRMAAMEKENEEYEAGQKDRELDELYERVGRPMWTQLDHDGFIAGGRGVSFPKRGVAGGKGSKERS